MMMHYNNNKLTSFQFAYSVLFYKEKDCVVVSMLLFCAELSDKMMRRSLCLSGKVFSPYSLS